MTSSNQTYITADLVEKELFEVEISEKEIITVKLTTVDVIYKSVDETVYDDIYGKIVMSETPTRVNASTFQTSNAYRTGTLKVYLNGQKIHNSEITESSSSTFSFDNYNTDLSDLLEVSYIKQ